MKRVITIATVVAMCICVFTHAQEKKRSPADQFALSFSIAMERMGEKITPELKKALSDLHPTFAAASKDDWMSKYFWCLVASEERNTIEWDKAKLMILKGEIISVDSCHSGKVNLTGRNGQGYITTEPKANDAFHVAETVDPRRVFIARSAE